MFAVTNKIRKFLFILESVVMCVTWQSHKNPSDCFLKVVVRADIIPRDFLQTPENYYLLLTEAKIQRLKAFHR